MSNKAFWDLVKPFLPKKGILTGTEISLAKDDKIVLMIYVKYLMIIT